MRVSRKFIARIADRRVLPLSTRSGEGGGGTYRAELMRRGAPSWTVQITSAPDANDIPISERRSLVRSRQNIYIYISRARRLVVVWM